MIQLTLIQFTITVRHNLKCRVIVWFALLEIFDQRLTFLFTTKSDQSKCFQRNRCLKVGRLFKHLLDLLKRFLVVTDINGILKDNWKKRIGIFRRTFLFNLSWKNFKFEWNDENTAQSLTHRLECYVVAYQKHFASAFHSLPGPFQLKNKNYRI